MQALRTKWEPEFGARMLVREPRADVTDAQLLRVHTLAHTAKVELALSAAKGMQRVNLDSDTIASPGTRAAARRAAGLVVAAVDEVMQPVLTLTLALALTLPLPLTPTLTRQRPAGRTAGRYCCRRHRRQAADQPEE